MPIQQLPPDIVSKIAAGEVIERPCFALKELLENSIDAKANSIDIEIQNFGLDRLAIFDNGGGMSPEDLKLAAQRHTTSKIHTLEDLTLISTLGFRGEALAAIASVSKTTLRSRTADNTRGYSLTINFQEQGALIPIGMTVGTHVLVEGLFANLPARKKFLHNTATEYRYLLDIITNIALAHPHIKFSFTHNDRRILTLNHHDSPTRHAQLLGEDLFGFLVPITHEHTYFQLTGYLAKPQLCTHSNHKQYLFLNHRRILSPALATAVREAYGTLLESSAYPVFVLHFQMRPEQIDLNVHPRKETVFFLNQSEILQAVHDCVRESLFQHNLTNIDSRWHIRPQVPPDAHEHTHLKHTVNNPTAMQLREQIISQYQPTPALTSSDIIQLHNTYIITQTQQGILILDQHAAHERVLYEKFLQAYQGNLASGQSHQLLHSMQLSLAPSDASLLEQNLVNLQKIGFAFDNSSNSLSLTHVPHMLKDHPLQQLLLDLLDDLQAEQKLRLNTRSHRMLSYLACRSAIMAGDKLTKERMRELLAELQSCHSEYTCPHGRPVKVEIPLQSMHKIFKRL